MLRTILIVGLLASISGADIAIGKLYRAVPTIANSEGVSPRTKYRFSMYFRAIDGFNAIKVSNKYKGNRTLYFYTSKGGYDYYTDKKSHNTIRIDRHSNVYMQYIGSNGRAGDWIKLKYYKVKSSRAIGSTYTDKWGKKYTVCEADGSKRRVIPYTTSKDYSLCGKPEYGYHAVALYDLYNRPVRSGASGYGINGRWQPARVVKNNYPNWIWVDTLTFTQRNKLRIDKADKYINNKNISLTKRQKVYKWTKTYCEAVVASDKVAITDSAKILDSLLLVK